MIPLNELILIKYPQANLNLDGNVRLVDHADGKGVIIGSWNIDNVPMPTEEDLNSWQNDSVIKATYQAKLNSYVNEPILLQLQELDLKSIRALRTNDTARLATYEAQAQELRGNLLPTNISDLL